MLLTSGRLEDSSHFSINSFFKALEWKGETDFSQTKTKK